MIAKIQPEIRTVEPQGNITVTIRGDKGSYVGSAYFYPQTGEWAIAFDVPTLESLRPLKAALDKAFAEAEQAVGVTK